jgi:SHS2 domain-containing protein
MRYKFLKHTADVKFQAFGKTIEEAFGNSALAMFNSMSEDKIKERKKFKIKAKGDDYENLLYNFLEELLILFDSKHFFLAKIKSLKIKNKKLSAEVVGDDAKNYELVGDIKAVTYNDMFVKKIKNKWVAQVVLDA